MNSIYHLIITVLVLALSQGCGIKDNTNARVFIDQDGQVRDGAIVGDDQNPGTGNTSGGGNTGTGTGNTGGGGNTGTGTGNTGGGGNTGTGTGNTGGGGNTGTGTGNTGGGGEGSTCPENSSNCRLGCLHPLSMGFDSQANRAGPCNFHLCLRDHPIGSLYFSEASYYIRMFGGSIIHSPKKCKDGNMSTTFGKHCKHPLAHNYSPDEDSLIPGGCYFRWCLDPKYEEYTKTSDIVEYMKHFGTELKHNKKNCKTLK